MKADIVIPTFGRDASVVINTIQSIFADSQTYSHISNVIIVDQNQPKLDLSILNNFKELIQVNYTTDFKQDSENNDFIIHAFGLAPSVTKAKNFGLTFCHEAVTIFFDDDVIVKEGTIENYLKLLSREDLTLVAGREVLPEHAKERGLLSKLKKAVKDSISQILLKEKNTVARVTKNGFFICDFSQIRSDLVEIDTIRGCNWACKRVAIEKAGGFDTNYKGSALREEADLVHRILKNGKGVYSSNSEVLHMRQLGGCNNLSMNYGALISKFENELYFQLKFFPNTRTIYFLLKLAPLSLSYFKSTFGISLLLGFHFSLIFYKKKSLS